MEGTSAAIRLFSTLALCLPAGMLGAAEADPRLPVVATASLPRSEGITVVDGFVYYLHYGRSGNGKDILQIDPESTVPIRLVEDAPVDQFAAADDRYVAYLLRTAVAQPIVLRDRKSGASSTSIRLREPVVAARLQENRLVVFQATEALFFSLPDLKLIGRKPAPWAGTQPYGSVQVQHQGNRFVATAARTLFVLDDDLNVLSMFPIAVPPARNRTGCEISLLKLVGSTALLVPRCGWILAYDLDTGRRRYELDVGGTYTNLEVVGDVLFVVDDSADLRRRMRLFDLHSGSSLGRAAAATHGIAARGGRLLTFEPGAAYRDPTRMVIYKPDLGAIRDEKMRMARVVAGCSGAAEDVARDPYAVVQACEAAGIDTYLGGVDPPREVHTALARYAAGLAQTTSKFGQTPAVLDRLEASAQSDALRALVASKQIYLGQAVTGPRTAAARPGVSKHAFPALGRPVFIGSAMLLPPFVSCAGGELNLHVHDAESFLFLKDVRIASCEDEDTGADDDVVESFWQVAGYLLVGLDQDDVSRPNLAVVDPRDFSLVGALALHGGVRGLELCGGKVLSFFDSRAVELDLKSARLLQPGTAELATCDAPGARQPLPESDDSVVSLVTQTPRFRVQGNSTDRATIARVEDKVSPDKSYEITLSPSMSFIGVPGRDAVVVLEADDLYRRVKLLDLVSRESRTLLELESPYQWGIPVVWRNYLLQPRDRDLLIYDLARSEVIGYDSGLIGEGLQPLCESCEDGNHISSLVLHGDRLLALTLNGVNSRLIDLPAYVQSFGSSDLFRRTR